MSLALLPVPAGAGVKEIVVEKTVPIGDGYERLEGHYVGELDPRDKANAIIQDLAIAPRNAAGKVEYYSTFAMVRPVDPKRLSGVLVYDVANRGRGTAKAMAEGHVNVISGWQGDLDEGPNVQFARVPVAPVTGPAWVRFIDVPAGTTTMPVKGGPQGDNDGRGFEVANGTNAHLYSLTSDSRPQDQVEVPRSQWAFADCTTTPFPGKPDLTQLCIKGGFDPKLGYTLGFTAKNPKVLGVGFAATRDLVSFFRYETGPTNPLAGHVRWAIGRGESQSGNFLRAYVNLGFNTAENGKQVFDGIMPIVAMRMIAMNYRFAASGGLADLYELGMDGVGWWGSYDDKVRGLGRHSLLDRCSAAGQCPKVAEIMGAAELRYHRGSVDFVGTDVKSDIPLPANVRRYYNAGVTHAGGVGGFSLSTPRPRNNGCDLQANPNPTDFANRALFAALVDWVTEGKEPPPSIYPTLAAGDLITPAAYAAQFPMIPGVPRPIPAELTQYDFSDELGFVVRDVSGVLRHVPPRWKRSLPLVVPRVDADGNELAGIRSPLLSAPLGTYVGWNLISSGYRAGRYCYSNGGFIPFAATKAERLARGDPRPSLEERYPSREDYVARVKAQADRLVAQRYMLPEDARAVVAQAASAPVH